MTNVETCCDKNESRVTSALRGKNNLTEFQKELV